MSITFDILFQYTSLDSFGLRLNFIFAFALILHFLYFSNNMTKNSFWIGISALLLCVIHSFQTTLTVRDYISLSLTIVVFLLVYLEFFSLAEKVSFQKLTLILFLVGIIYFGIRHYNYLNNGELWNYNWTSLLILFSFIGLFKNSKYFKFGLFILAIAFLTAGSESIKAFK